MLQLSVLEILFQFLSTRRVLRVRERLTPARTSAAPLQDSQHHRNLSPLEFCLSFLLMLACLMLSTATLLVVAGAHHENVLITMCYDALS